MAYLSFQNCTRQEYETILYSQQAQHKIKILFNNVELQNADRYCEKLSIKSRIIPNGAKRFSLNNFISKELDLILHDIDTSIIQDQVVISIGTLVNNVYEYVPIGIFNIQDTPTTDKNKTTIKLRDNSVKFDFNYNAKPLLDENGGTATKLQILQDICTKASVTCNISSFIGSTDLVGTYDNTISARQYIADLAESAGKIATINRSGELIFVDLNNLTTWNIPLSIVEKYEKGKNYKIGQVVYEDGVVKYETTSSNYDTLYLDASNPYISSQAQVNSILGEVDNFEIDSINTGRILGNPAIDSYDLINVYNDKASGNPSVFKTLATHDLIYNGILKATYDTQIGEEERETNVSILGQPTFKKWAKSEINNINGELILQTGRIDSIETPIASTSGSTLYLQDSAETELVNFELEGKTEQETTTGKNFFNIGDITTSGILVVSDTGFTLTKTADARFSPWYSLSKEIPAGSYKVVSTNSGNYNDTPGIQVRYNSGTATTFGFYGNNANFTLTSAVNQIRFYLGSGTTTGYYFTSTDLMFIKSDVTDTSYEKYTGTIPNPNPEYPSELVSVGYENLFNPTEEWTSYYGVSAAINNQEITLNGTSTSGVAHKIADANIPVGIYTVSLNEISGTHTTGKNIWVDFMNDSTKVGGCNFRNDKTQPQIVTTTGITNLIRIGYDDNDNLSDYTFTIQIEKGTQVHSYIPYGKYGIEVKTIGKNLFNEAYPNIGTSVKYIAIKVGDGTFTMSTNMPFASTYTNLFFLSGNVSSGASTNTNGIWNGHNRTINSTDGYITIAYRNAEGISPENYNTQLEKSNQATSYEPYKSNSQLYLLNEPLRGIGDYKDRLYVQNDELYIERKIGKLVLNGSEEWDTFNNSFFAPVDVSYLKEQEIICKSTYYLGAINISGGLQAYNNGNNTIEFYYPSSLNRIYLRDDRFSNINDLKNWLLINNVEVQYILAESIIEVIGEVKIPSTYEGVTNIFTTDELEPNMDITYVRDTAIGNYVEGQVNGTKTIEERHYSEIKLTEEGITSRVETTEIATGELSGRINAVEIEQTSQQATINILGTNIDLTNGEVREVTTTTGFTFNAEGMTISDSDSNFRALHRKDGTYYYDGENVVGQYTKDGSKQKDLELFGVYTYGKASINSPSMFIAQLYTDSNGEVGMGHFYNGGE